MQRQRGRQLGKWTLLFSLPLQKLHFANSAGPLSTIYFHFVLQILIGTSNPKWSRFLATKIVKQFYYTFKGFPSADFKLTTFCCITAVESDSNIKVRPPSKSLFWNRLRLFKASKLNLSHSLLLKIFGFFAIPTYNSLLP